MANKMTKRDYFNTLLAIDEVTSNPDLVTFIEKEIELLNKKKASSKNKKTNNDRPKMDAIIAYLTGVDGIGVTASDILKGVNELADDSLPKVSALLRKLIAEGEVEKTTEKRRSYFRLMNETEIEDDEMEGDVENED